MITKAGLYIHIPFCASRCIYCGFYSTTLLPLRDRYVDALRREMELLPYKPEISTIYLGGGTPSQLTHDELARLFNHIYNNVYSVADDAEVTMECNPDDIHSGMFSGLPVNRVSMGAQTFSDKRLKFLHRRHSAKEVDEAVRTLRKDGIGNISIDLMFGFPGETMEDWKDDIRHALSLNPEHISAYGLMYEEGTQLYRMLQQGKVEEADEQLSLDMYSTLIDMLTAAGYEHYEISNFAKEYSSPSLQGNHKPQTSTNGHCPNAVRGEVNLKPQSPYRSRHNSSYWHDIPYIGLGAGAHSYYNHARHWNPNDINKYIGSIEKGILPYEEEQIDEDTHYDDIVMTALRTCEGIDLGVLDDAHRRFLLQNSKGFVKDGLLELADNHLRLTRQGINISNRIMSDLMDV